MRAGTRRSPSSTPAGPGAPPSRCAMGSGGGSTCRRRSRGPACGSSTSTTASRCRRGAHRPASHRLRRTIRQSGPARWARRRADRGSPVWWSAAPGSWPSVWGPMLGGRPATCGASATRRARWTPAVRRAPSEARGRNRPRRWRPGRSSEAWWRWGRRPCCCCGPTPRDQQPARRRARLKTSPQSCRRTVTPG